MSIIDGQLADINFLSQFGFKFTLARLPEVTFMTQSVELPSVQLGVIEQPTPFVSIPLSGKITYENLSVTFKVDENMVNYTKTHQWMTDLGSANDFTGYSRLKNSPIGSKEWLTSDITLSILKSSMNPNISVVFKDAFPTALSGLRFGTTDIDVAYLEATVVFDYLSYEFRTVT